MINLHKMKVKAKKLLNRWVFIRKGGRRNFRKSFFVFLGTLILIIFVLNTLMTSKQRVNSYETKSGVVKNEVAPVKNKPPSSKNENLKYIEVGRDTPSPKKKKKKVIRLLGQQSFGITSGRHGNRIRLQSGEKLIAKLSSSIDSRDKGALVSAQLYFNIRTRLGVVIPKGTRFLGQFSHQKGNKRVFIKFTKLILPGGKVTNINATAMNPHDFRSGIVGNHHSKVFERLSGPMALSALSTAADVLTSKEQVGSSAIVAVKADVGNAGLQALSKATEMEAARAVNDPERNQEYLTVDINTPLIVQILEEVKIVNDN